MWWWYLACIAFVLGQAVRIPFGLGFITPLDVVIIAGWFVYRPWSYIAMIRSYSFGNGLLFIITTMLVSLGIALPWFGFTDVALGSLYAIRIILYTLPLLIVIRAKEKAFRWLISTALLASVFLGFAQILVFPNLAALVRFGWDPHWYRLVGTWLDPNFMGMLLAASVVYTLEPFILKQEKNRLWLPALLFLGLIFTFSRSSYLAFFCMCCVLLVRFRRREVLGITVLATILLVASLVPRMFFDRLQGIDRSESALARIVSWRHALVIASKHPQGVGYNLYRQAQLRYHVSVQENAHGATGSDSSLLTILVTTGVLGLAVWIYFLAKLAGWASIQGDVGWVLFAALSGWIVHAQFVNSLLFVPLMFLFWTWVGQVRSVREQT